jgi:diguanylate cyclase (GGDEF)-like protein/hemerythrin-like metal-binding protein/PAS domain S-box-containing protein
MKQMNSIDIFPWNQNFNTGLPKVDEQHQRLVQLLNLLASHIAFQSDIQKLNAVFDELSDYAVYHFNTEAEIWHEHLPNDPLESEHQQYHNDFASTVIRLKAELTVKPVEGVLLEVLSYLTRWLASHILGDDRYMAKVVLALQSGLTMAQAKEQSKNELRGSMRVLIEIILSAYYSLTTNNFQLMKNISELKRVEQELHIASTAFEAQEGIIVTDARNVILRVNQSFTRLTGYSEDEAIGQTPALFKSGKHDAEFYRQMWDALTRDHYWHGEIWNRRKNGEVHPEWLTITAVTSAEGEVTNYVSFFSDLSQYKKDEAAIHSLAFYDPLTGLPNRRLLLDRLQHTFAASSRHHYHSAVLFIDLDNFKNLNDSKGHNIGDLLLIEVASRLQACVREVDTVSRLGGDEFVVIIEELSENPPQAAAQTEDVCNKILTAISQPYSLKAYEYHSSASIGICLFRHQEVTVDELLKRADTAMYQAKSAGRNTQRFYDQAMQAALEVRTSLESDLHRALAENQFRLYYQMQVDHTGHIIGAEVLIRWQHPQHGLILPMQFIPLAEETGLILPIGQWVLETACAQIKAWEANQLTCKLQLAVNVSARQFHQPDFVELVSQTLNRHALNPDQLKLELTESVVLSNIKDTIVKMQALRKVGVRFSMDDFGTGYSSLSYLTQLPLNQLKIDQSFVRNIGLKHSDAVIVQTIIGMANNLGMEVIAEGVETEVERAFLEQHACALCQGFLFGRPVPVEEFEERLKSL